MWLEQVTLRHFRNIPAAEVELSPQVTVLVGDNGQGKTNFLEAVYALATLRPLRAQRPSELIQAGEREAVVEGRVQAEVGHHLRLRLRPGQREEQVDGKRPESVEAWCRHLQVVAFLPDDLEIAKGGPAQRRRWLDRAVFTSRPAYLAAWRRYHRVLKARNRLLRDAPPSMEAQLEAFDPPLAAAAAELCRHRLAYLDRLRPYAAGLVDEIAGIPSGFELRYLTAGVEAPTDPEAWLVALAGRRDRDRRRGHSTLGPHTDSLELTLGDRDLRAYGSQGQQRTAVLGLKIAEIEQLRDQRGEAPLLLLDDVASELDPKRNAKLLAYLAGFDGQTLITTTHRDLAPVPSAGGLRWWEVEGGSLRPG